MSDSEPKDVAPADIEAIFQEFGKTFGDLFGGAGGGSDRDLRLDLALDAGDRGRKRAVPVARFFRCAGCTGSGRAPDSGPCAACEGKGQHHHAKGAYRVSATCGECRGSGFGRPCDRCSGAGGETREEVLQVAIPPSIATGQILRLRGKGNDLNDGRGPGDLYLTVRVPEGAPLSVEASDPSRAGVMAWVALGAILLVVLLAALLLG